MYQNDLPILILVFTHLVMTDDYFSNKYHYVSMVPDVPCVSTSKMHYPIFLMQIKIDKELAV